MAKRFHSVRRVGLVLLIVAKCGSAAADGQANGPFVDVPTKSSFADLLRDLASRGILQGYPDATFRPRQVVSQRELELTLLRTFQWVDRELSHYEGHPDRE